jgi:predicted nucleic acid-binding Zn ribbon protein
MTLPTDTITCVECGGTAHLISYLPDDEPLEDGFPVAYRCADCLERFDLVWEGVGPDD